MKRRIIERESERPDDSADRVEREREFYEAMPTAAPTYIERDVDDYERPGLSGWAILGIVLLGLLLLLLLMGGLNFGGGRSLSPSGGGTPSSGTAPR